MPLTASAVVGGLGAIGKFITGNKMIKEADRIERNNPRPKFNIQDEYFTNRDLSSSIAQRGLSERALNFAQTGAERGLTASLGAATQVGGGVNSISQLYDSYHRDLNQTAALDQQLQDEHWKTYMSANNALAGQKTQKWVLDEYEPYKDKARAAAQMRAAGMQNKQTAVSEAVGTLSAYNTGQLNKDQVATNRMNAETAARNAGGGAGGGSAPSYANAPYVPYIPGQAAGARPFSTQTYAPRQTSGSADPMFDVQDMYFNEGDNEWGIGG